MPVWINNKSRKNIKVVFTGNTILINDEGGKQAVLLLDFYPGLQNATETERQRWSLSGDERSLIWEELDTEISMAGLLD